MSSRKLSKRVVETRQADDDEEENDKQDEDPRRRISNLGNSRIPLSRPSERSTSNRIAAGFNLRNQTEIRNSFGRAGRNGEVEDSPAQEFTRSSDSRHSSRSRQSPRYDPILPPSPRKPSKDRKTSDAYQDRLSINILTEPNEPSAERSSIRRILAPLDLTSSSFEPSQVHSEVDKYESSYQEYQPSMLRKRSKSLSIGSSQQEKGSGTFQSGGHVAEEEYTHARRKTTNNDSSVPQGFRSASRYTWSNEETPSKYSSATESSRIMDEMGSRRPNLSRDVLPLPIEIPDTITDTDAFRRYLSQNHVDSVGKGDGIRKSISVMQPENMQSAASSLDPYPPSVTAIGSNPMLRLSHQNPSGLCPQMSMTSPPGQPDCHQTNYQKRTASLSHAIMTLALLSASAAQLRFIVSYSHVHSYPTLNYFLICSCIVIEIFVGIGFVLLARFDFSELCQEKLHSYLIFGLFVVTVANVIVAAFALDDHICDNVVQTTTPSHAQLLNDEQQIQLEYAQRNPYNQLNPTI